MAIFLLFSLAGFGLVGFVFYDGVNTLIENLTIAKRAQTADAVVLSVRQDTSCISGIGHGTCWPVFFPKVRFTTARGEHVDAEAADPSSDESRANVGRSLKVYYDPLNPHHVKASRWLDTQDELVVFVLALVPIGLLFLGLRRVATWW